MENERDDRVIFLKDLLFAALYQWRRILAAALVFAAVLGGLSAISQTRAVSNVPSKENMQTAYEVYESEKQLLDKNVKMAEKLLATQEEYNQTSVLMELDPYRVYQASIELTVPANPASLNIQAASEQDNVGAILHAYGVYLSSDPVIASAAEAMDLETKYLWELIQLVDGETVTRSLSMTISYTTKEGAQTLLDMFLGYLEQARQQVEQSVGKHSINIVTSGVNERIDLSLTEKQAAAKTRLETLQAELKAATDARSALSAPAFSTTVSVKKIVILAVLGAVLGALLIAVWACLCHIAGVKVYSVRTLQNRTGIKVLGCIPSYGKQCKLDSWLRKLEGRSIDEKLYGIVAVNVQHYCAGAQNLLIVCDGEPDRANVLVQALQTRGIPVTQVGSLLRSAAALETLPKSDCVLLIAQCDYSRYTDIERQMEMIADRSKLAGCILVNG